MNDKVKTYEAMFLLEAGRADFDTASEPIRAVLDRSEAEVLSIRPWDEKKLTYEIRGHKRGLYVLTYFKVDPTRVVEIEHECRLNEDILRVLILHRQQLTEEELEKETPATRQRREFSERKAAADKKSAEEAAKKKDAEEAKPTEEAGEVKVEEQTSETADKPDQTADDTVGTDQAGESKVEEQEAPRSEAREESTEQQVADEVEPVEDATEEKPQE